MGKKLKQRINLCITQNDTSLAFDKSVPPPADALVQHCTSTSNIGRSTDLSAGIVSILNNDDDNDDLNEGKTKIIVMVVLRTMIVTMTIWSTSCYALIHHLHGPKGPKTCSTIGPSLLRALLSRSSHENCRNGGAE